MIYIFKFFHIYIIVIIYFIIYFLHEIFMPYSIVIKIIKYKKKKQYSGNIIIKNLFNEINITVS